MSLSNYAGLVASIQSWSTYTDITSDMAADFAFWAHQEICRRLRANVMLKTSTALTVSGETLTAPTDLLELKTFWLDLSPRVFLRTTSPELVHRKISETATNTYPTDVALEGANLRFAPLFSTTATGYATYYASPPLMSADSDTNVVFAKYPYLYLWGALEALHSFKEDDETAQNFGNKFGALIEDINTRDAASSVGGSITLQPAVASIV